MCGPCAGSALPCERTIVSGVGQLKIQAAAG